MMPDKKCRCDKCTKTGMPHAVPETVTTVTIAFPTEEAFKHLMKETLDEYFGTPTQQPKE